MSKYEESGMTDLQYKGMLIDEQEKWEEILALLQAEDTDAAIKYAQKMIELVERKLMF
jgi:hypothetical protein